MSASGSGVSGWLRRRVGVWALLQPRGSACAGPGARLSVRACGPRRWHRRAAPSSRAPHAHSRSAATRTHAHSGSPLAVAASNPARPRSGVSGSASGGVRARPSAIPSGAAGGLPGTRGPGASCELGVGSCRQWSAANCAWRVSPRWFAAGFCTVRAVERVRNLCFNGAPARPAAPRRVAPPAELVRARSRIGRLDSSRFVTLASLRDCILRLGMFTADKGPVSRA